MGTIAGGCYRDGGDRSKSMVTEGLKAWGTEARGVRTAAEREVGSAMMKKIIGGKGRVAEREESESG